MEGVLITTSGIVPESTRSKGVEDEWDEVGRKTTRISSSSHTDGTLETWTTKETEEGFYRSTKCGSKIRAERNSSWRTLLELGKGRVSGRGRRRNKKKHMNISELYIHNYMNEQQTEGRNLKVVVLCRIEKTSNNINVNNFLPFALWPHQNSKSPYTIWFTSDFVRSYKSVKLILRKRSQHQTKWASLGPDIYRDLNVPMLRSYLISERWLFGCDVDPMSLYYFSNPRLINTLSKGKIRLKGR